MADVAKAILTPRRELDNEQVEYYAKFQDADGNALPIGGPGTDILATDVFMTGYTLGAAAAVAAGDNVRQAIAKLEKRIADLEAA